MGRLMLEMNSQALSAITLWSALNLGFMLLLGLNVFRIRASEKVILGTGSNERLERAIRAHGNNVEYVPGLLFCLLLLALQGESASVLHAAGACLLVARLLHAQGIQNRDKPLPLMRVFGNLICWTLFIAVVVRLIMVSL